MKPSEQCVGIEFMISALGREWENLVQRSRFFVHRAVSIHLLSDPPDLKMPELFGAAVFQHCSHPVSSS